MVALGLAEPSGNCKADAELDALQDVVELCCNFNNRPPQCFWLTLCRRHLKDPACLVGAHKQAVRSGTVMIFFGVRVVDEIALSGMNARFPLAVPAPDVSDVLDVELLAWSFAFVELSVLGLSTPLSSLDACILGKTPDPLLWSL